MKVVIDVETERLESPDKIHVIVTREVDGNRIRVFRDPITNPSPWYDHARRVSTWIGHNIIPFDRKVIGRHLPLVPIRDETIVDTLTVCRLLNYQQAGGNSVEAWGEKFGIPKIAIRDFSKWTQELEDRCIVDTEIQRNIYLKVLDYINSPVYNKLVVSTSGNPSVFPSVPPVITTGEEKQLETNRALLGSLPLEMKLQVLCEKMKENGFGFDFDRGCELFMSLYQQLGELYDEMRSAFPDRTVLDKEVVPRETKSGALHLAQFKWLPVGDHGVRDLRGYVANAPFSLFKRERFNPASKQQCIDQLWKYGWKPINKTDGYIEALKDRDTPGEKLTHFSVYGWKVDDDNLATLPEDAPQEARKLVEWLKVSSRYRTLRDWISLARPSNGVLDGIQLHGEHRIHGTFNGIGAWTHRMSHKQPNMANIPAHRDRKGRIAFLGKDFRQLWKATGDNLLVGCDADGIQLRVLAHYMNDERFTEALINGDKDNGTDAHSLNAKALGPICRGREPAKTFIYAWLLGAGVAMVGSILECSKKEASEAIANFISYYPGLERLKKEVIPNDARRGYFIGFDGRRVLCDSEHFMLAGYLQNGEKVVMARAADKWNSRLQREGIPYLFVDFVHDEFVTETVGDQETAELIGRIQSDSIREVGEELLIGCPMKGNFKIGRNWYDIH